MDYFQYLGIAPSQQDLVEHFGQVLDGLMTLDLNMTGRPRQHYLASQGPRAKPISTTAAAALLQAVSIGDLAILVTGCAVRPEIEPSIGEPDGPAGAAALARALFICRRALSIIIVAEPLVGQTTAALRAAGAAIVTLDDLIGLRPRERPLFAVSILGLPNDLDLSVKACELFDKAPAKAVIAVECLGIAIDGKGYFSDGGAFDRGVLRSDAVFLDAKRRGVLRFTCFDNPNEAGTGRLHMSETRHPPIADRFEFLIPGTSANWSAYALAAAMAGLSGQLQAAFTAELDVRAVEACLRAGAIDPFSGLADPAMGVDTIERGVHEQVTGLMRRAVAGFLASRRQPVSDDLVARPAMVAAGEDCRSRPGHSR